MALNLKTETVFTGDAAAAQPPLPPEQLAPHFPQLEILECLGRGGMGVVYKARQKTLNRFVALKLLAPERVGDAKFAERFTREAQALAALNHPNIVTIHDFGQAGGFYFLIMEYVDGLNLRQLLRTRKFTPEEALAIVPPLCDALQFAHDRGVVHRDIKPENLLLDRDGRVKVADFGIAKMLHATNGGGTTGTPGPPETLTQSTLGTPGYTAPEQKTDPQKVDSRADIYSLGVVFYELLTGELPGSRSSRLRGRCRWTCGWMKSCCAPWSRNRSFATNKPACSRRRWRRLPQPSPRRFQRFCRTRRCDPAISCRVLAGPLISARVWESFCCSCYWA